MANATSGAISGLSLEQLAILSCLSPSAPSTWPPDAPPALVARMGSSALSTSLRRLEQRGLVHRRGAWGGRWAGRTCTVALTEAGARVRARFLPVYHFERLLPVARGEGGGCATLSPVVITMDNAPTDELANPLTRVFAHIGLSGLDLAARLDLSSSYLNAVTRGAIRHPSLLWDRLASLGYDVALLREDYSAWRAARLLVVDTCGGGRDLLSGRGTPGRPLPFEKVSLAGGPGHSSLETEIFIQGRSGTPGPGHSASPGRTKTR